MWCLLQFNPSFIESVPVFILSHHLPVLLLFCLFLICCSNTAATERLTLQDCCQDGRYRALQGQDCTVLPLITSSHICRWVTPGFSNIPGPLVGLKLGPRHPVRVSTVSSEREWFGFVLLIHPCIWFIQKWHNFQLKEWKFALENVFFPVITVCGGVFNCRKYPQGCKSQITSATLNYSSSYGGVPHSKYTVSAGVKWPPGAFLTLKVPV